MACDEVDSELRDRAELERITATRTRDRLRHGPDLDQTWFRRDLEKNNNKTILVLELDFQGKMIEKHVIITLSESVLVLV